MFQAAACTEEIGWRQNARHLLLVATDATFHKAGDGAVVSETLEK
jgi:protocadherin alpha